MVLRDQSDLSNSGRKKKNFTHKSSVLGREHNTSFNRAPPSPGSTGCSPAGRRGRERGRSLRGGAVPADRLAACRGNRSYRRARPGWPCCWRAARNLEKSSRVEGNITSVQTKVGSAAGRVAEGKVRRLTWIAAPLQGLVAVGHRGGTASGGGVAP